MTRRFAIGVDYGTNSVRGLVADIDSGEEVATHVFNYPSGEAGILLDPRDPNVARQHPGDYLDGFRVCVGEAASAAIAAAPDAEFVGLGVDTTGSTPIPVDAEGVALALKDEFRDTPAAQAWLWKDHTSHEEAKRITRLATERGEPYLAKCGGVYSSEWYWAKIARCMAVAPEVAEAAASWVELADFVPAWATGSIDPATLPRGICAAGHKAMYSESWGGLPSIDFLESVQPGLSRFRYVTRAIPSDRRAGGLSAEVAASVGLPEGLPVAVGAFDAHMGAVGAGARPGVLVKIMGTSTCDCLPAPLDAELPDIPGVCGIVPESIMPGCYGIEAGQSAVGDIFNWFVGNLSSGLSHEALTEQASMLRPGESGLVALDWNNGNRTVLVDPLLSGLLVGQTLHTTAAEVYRALVEATAFGALKIIRRVEEYGVRVDEVVNCGGIAEKNPLVMQVYADVCDRPMKVSRSAQTCALGAAIFGAVAGNAHASVAGAQAAMTGVKEHVYEPIPENAAAYRRLFSVYERLHDAFGLRDSAATLGDVMKELITIRAGGEERRMTINDLREAVCQANRDLVTYGLVTLTWGNVSGLSDDREVFAIKPSGVPYDHLRPEHIVLVRVGDGEVVEGDLRPSSDTPTHRILYKAFEGIGGVTHTHSPRATAFAQARTAIPCYGTTHADHFYGPTPVTRALTAEEVADAYEEHTGRVIVERFAELDPIAVPGVLAAGHAPFTWGKNASKSLENAVALEAVAGMALDTLRLDTGAPALEDYVLEKHYKRKHGANAYYGQLR